MKFFAWIAFAICLMPSFSYALPCLVRQQPRDCTINPKGQLLLDGAAIQGGWSTSQGTALSYSDRTPAPGASLGRIEVPGRAALDIASWTLEHLDKSGRADGSIALDGPESGVLRIKRAAISLQNVTRNGEPVHNVPGSFHYTGSMDFGNGRDIGPAIVRIPGGARVLELKGSMAVDREGWLSVGDAIQGSRVQLAPVRFREVRKPDGARSIHALFKSLDSKSWEFAAESLRCRLIPVGRKIHLSVSADLTPIGDLPQGLSLDFTGELALNPRSTGPNAVIEGRKYIIYVMSSLQGATFLLPYEAPLKGPVILAGDRICRP